MTCATLLDLALVLMLGVVFGVVIGYAIWGEE